MTEDEGRTLNANCGKYTRSLAISGIVNRSSQINSDGMVDLRREAEAR
jgi:hypothetical protein